MVEHLLSSNNFIDWFKWYNDKSDKMCPDSVLTHNTQQTNLIVCYTIVILLVKTILTIRTVHTCDIFDGVSHTRALPKTNYILHYMKSIEDTLLCTLLNYYTTLIIILKY